MKKIENKVFPSLPKTEGNMATTASLLSVCIDGRPEGGFSVAQMRARFRVADAIEALTDGVIVLEDADYKTAQAAVEAMRWNVASPDLIAFAEQFEI